MIISSLFSFSQNDTLTLRHFNYTHSNCQNTSYYPHLTFLYVYWLCYLQNKIPHCNKHHVWNIIHTHKNISSPQACDVWLRSLPQVIWLHRNKVKIIRQQQQHKPTGRNRWDNQFDGYLFEFVQIVGLLVEVEPQQLALQVFYEGLAADEVLDDAVRKRMAVQLHISCSTTTTTTTDYVSTWADSK